MHVAILFVAPVPLTDREREEQLAAEEDLEAVRAVECSLEELGHTSERMAVTDDVGALLERLREGRPAVVFNLCESFRGESLPQANVAALLELLGVCYTGSGPEALGVSTDKALAKAVLAAHGIPVPRYQVAYWTELRLDPSLPFPVIVKPLYEDGSYGITGESVVGSAEALAARVEYIHETYRQPSIVEEFIEGREVNAAVLGSDPAEVLPLSEIEFRDFPPPMPRIYSFRAKWVTGSFEYQNTIPTCPISLPEEVDAAIKDVALRSHLALGCRDYSRVDIRVAADWKPYVIEVNANPDTTVTDCFMRSVLQSGRTFTEFVACLIDGALKTRISSGPSPFLAAVGRGPAQVRGQ
jgi:D-alanine-D-alanine ligase